MGVGGNGTLTERGRKWFWGFGAYELGSGETSLSNHFQPIHSVSLQLKSRSQSYDRMPSLQTAVSPTGTAQ